MIPTETPPIDRSRQILLLGVGGLSLGAIRHFVEREVMPNLAELLPGMACGQLRQTFFSHPHAAWTTFFAGCESIEHGVFDEYCFDHERRRLVRTPESSRKFSRLSPDEICIVSDTKKSASKIVFHGKPTTFAELEKGLARTTEILRANFDQVRSEYRSGARRVVALKMTVLDSLFLRLHHVLGIEQDGGARKSWIAETEKVFRALDEQLGSLGAAARRNGATMAIFSPYSFVPAGEKIAVNELLRRSKLLEPAEALAQYRYDAVRFFEKQKKKLKLVPRDEYALTGLLPIDWRRTLAVCLHGEDAAFVYLNTPERFGTKTLATAAQRESAEAETIASLAGARHPWNGDRLFQEVFSTAQRFGVDPLEKGWPEIIGIPTTGYQVRPRMDPARQSVRPEPAISAARIGEGFFLRQGHDAKPTNHSTIELSKAFSQLISFEESSTKE
jgi:predicted AlkP superfamily phosphohydrolase/phosphomutase